MRRRNASARIFVLAIHATLMSHNAYQNFRFI